METYHPSSKISFFTPKNYEYRNNRDRRLHDNQRHFAFHCTAHKSKTSTRTVSLSFLENFLFLIKLTKDTP